MWMFGWSQRHNRWLKVFVSLNVDGLQPRKGFRLLFFLFALYDRHFPKIVKSCSGHPKKGKFIEKNGSWKFPQFQCFLLMYIEESKNRWLIFKKSRLYLILSCKKKINKMVFCIYYSVSKMKIPYLCTSTFSAVVLHVCFSTIILIQFKLVIRLISIADISHRFFHNSFKT